MPTLKRSASGGYKARTRIPTDVSAEYGQRFGQRVEAKFSAPGGTPTAEAERRFAEWLTEFKTRVATIRAERSGQGATITHRQAHVLAADWYRWFVGRHEDNPGPAARWEAARDAIRDALEREEPGGPDKHEGKWSDDAVRAVLPQAADCAETQTFLASKNMVLGLEARDRFLRALFPQLAEALKRLAAVAGGHYGIDRHAATLPEPKGHDAGKTVGQLAEAWIAERGHATSTLEVWRPILRDLDEYLAGRSAASVTEDDARAWLQSRITPKRTARTVSNNWQKGGAALFAWAKNNKLVASNPFRGVRIAKSRRIITRETQAFTQTEALTILAAAEMISDTRRPDDAAKRWLPWLCAYTGARSGEIAQLRGRDVVTQDGIAALRLTPEAGTIKNGRARMVPLHAHLIEQGFVEWAAGRGEGPLFYAERRTTRTRRASGPPKPPAAQVRQRLAEWVRGLGVTDPALQPNHAWRHTFKQIGRRAGISDTTLDDICGHAPATEGRAYGAATLRDKAEALGRFPRFSTADLAQTPPGRDGADARTSACDAARASEV